MAEITKSGIVAFKEETTTSELIDISAGAEFVPARSGFSFSGATETIDSDELINSIGKTKSFIAKEIPTASFPKYLKHSGVEGQAPEYGILVKSAMGSEDIQATERDVVSATAGDSTTAATITVDTGEGVEYSVGKAVLVKDGTNGWNIRNVSSIATDVLTLNYNLANAPTAGDNLGRVVQYSPTVKNHPSYSAHYFQAGTNSSFTQAIAGCRTTSMAVEFPASGFAEMNFEMEGTEYFFNQYRVGASDSYIDFNDGAAQVAQVSLGLYKSPHELAREIQAKMDAQSTDNITCTYSDTDGKFTIASDGGTFSLLWNTGTNTANTIGDLIGFVIASDDTSANTYTSDNAQTFDPPVTPSYDTVDNIVVKGAELLIGDFDQFTCRKATTASFSISTPKTDIPSICSTTGVDSSVTLEREATFSATIILNEFEAGLFDKFINNTTTSLMFNAGPKSASNWIAGKCVNIYMPSASITSHIIADQDGYQVINLEAMAFVTTNSEEVFINFV